MKKTRSQIKVASLQLHQKFSATHGEKGEASRIALTALARSDEFGAWVMGLVRHTFLEFSPARLTDRFPGEILECILFLNGTVIYRQTVTLAILPSRSKAGESRTSAPSSGWSQALVISA